MGYCWGVVGWTFFGLIMSSNEVKGDRFLNFFITVIVDLPGLVFFQLGKLIFPADKQITNEPTVGRTRSFIESWFTTTEVFKLENATPPQSKPPYNLHRER